MKSHFPFVPVLFLLASLSCTNNTDRLTQDNIWSRRLVTMLGSVQDEYIKLTHPETEVLLLDNVPDLLVSLKAGQCEGAVLTYETAGEVIKQDNSIKLLVPELFEDSIGFAFADDSLLTRFNVFLKEIGEDGTLRQISDKWLELGDAAPAEPVEFAQNARILVVGTAAMIVPFTFLRDQINCGLDIDIVNMFCARNGMQPEYRNLPFASLIASLAAKKVDLLASCITITEERAKQVKFSVPYYASKSGIYILNDQASALSVEDFNDADKKIGVLIATWQELYLREHFSKAQIIPLTNTPDLLSLLRSGGCHALFLAQPVCRYMMEESSDIVYLDEYTAQTEVSAGFRLNETVLKDQFNEFLKEINSNGIHRQMTERWLERTDGTMPDIPEADKGAGLLRIGTTCMDVPFSFYQEGTPAGFDIELSRRFAAYIGKKPEFVISDFGGMLASMSAGKLDMMANYIMRTEERSKNYSFSDTYLKTYSSMIVSRDLSFTNDTAIEGPGFFKKIKESFFRNIIFDKRYLLLWKGLLLTLLIAVSSALAGTLAGGLICFMRMSKNPLMKGFAGFYIGLFRGIPQVVMLMLMFYVVFSSSSLSGIAVSVITFSMIFGAYTSEMFRASIGSVPKGQTEAGIALGFSKVQTFMNIVLPQALRHVFPVYKGEFIALVKLTSIVGYIAVQDLTKAGDIIRSRTFDAFFPLIVISVVYFLLAWGLSRLLELSIPTSIRQDLQSK